MFALVIAFVALALAVFAGAMLDPRSSGGDADDRGPTRDEILLARVVGELAH
jgi:hypothetical protein